MKNKTNGYDGTAQSYLFELDQSDEIMGTKKVLLPKLEKETLDALAKKDTPFVVANVWSRAFSYNFGAFTFDGGKITPLDEAESATLLNEDFIFECGRSDYKGLQAISIDPKQEFFVMHDRISQPNKIELFFDTAFVNEAYIKSVEVFVRKSIPDAEIIIKRKWLVLYSDDYKNMVETLPVTLI